MKKIIFILFWCSLIAAPSLAEDVVYLNTEQFRDRIFDYKTEREWVYKGDKPCVIDFYMSLCCLFMCFALIMEELRQT